MSGPVAGPSRQRDNLDVPVGDLIDLDDFPILPPGSFHSTFKESSDSDVQLLLEPPEGMRKKKTNVDNPIVVPDSDSEDDDKDNLLRTPRKNSKQVTPPETPSKQDKKRARVSSDRAGISVHDRLPPVASGSGSRHAEPINGPGTAGPSTSRAAPIDVDGIDEAPAKRLRLDRSTAEDFLPEVLEILPDLCAEWTLATLKIELDAGKRDECVQRAVGLALEIVPSYPKAGDPKTKTSNQSQVKEDPLRYKSRTYRVLERMQPFYKESCLTELARLFPKVPMNFIRSTFAENAKLFVPTYYKLVEEAAKEIPSYGILRRGRLENGKSKDRAFESEEFELEKAYLNATLEREKAEASEHEARRLVREAAIENGEGVECGCCFGEEVMSEMFQCPDGHLFCRECATRHAETKLGDRCTVIICMDTSGCSAPFTEAELKRFLSDKSLELYHRLKQIAELAAAALDGLEQCPGCDYAAIIENPEEKLFRCLNELCKQITCRKCKRLDHIPKTCDEMEADRRLDKRHVVEEAMSEAYIRKCPNCSRPYIKQDGCNKIHCSGCHTLSCYICQKVIKGYDHFDQNPGDYTQPRATNKCTLWDKNEAANDQQAILRARDAAREEARAAAVVEGIEIEDRDLDVDHPPDPPAVPALDYGDLMAQAEVHRRRAEALLQRLNRLGDAMVPPGGAGGGGVENWRDRIQNHRLQRLREPIGPPPDLNARIAEARRLVPQVPAPLPQVVAPNLLNMNPPPPPPPLPDVPLLIPGRFPAGAPEPNLPQRPPGPLGGHPRPGHEAAERIGRQAARLAAVAQVARQLPAPVLFE